LKPLNNLKGTPHMSDDFKDYACHYYYQRAEWGITIRAASEADALARMKAMQTGKVDGELKFTLLGLTPRPAVSILTAIINFFRGTSAIP
jgi:hypothetical protein